MLSVNISDVHINVHESACSQGLQVLLMSGYTLIQRAYERFEVIFINKTFEFASRKIGPCYSLGSLSLTDLHNHR